jgi:hypothetical protein
MQQAKIGFCPSLRDNVKQVLIRQQKLVEARVATYVPGVVARQSTKLEGRRDGRILAGSSNSRLSEEMSCRE